MTFSQLFTLIKNVVISPEVIIVTILLILYLNLVFYIVQYQKPRLSSLQSRIQKNLQKPPAEAKKDNTPTEQAK
ncbi:MULTISPECIES: hypothetical protein [unclassified Treponema]|uniref:hypothetical protein n=1 Tax=unclassified Treponema TaxID=2638727 RepID=UPI0005300F3E|nr:MULTISPECIES: hypothetical protein [unclassified Treponema]AIW90284.1 hypothetical protein JO41_11105 [Treponema sp. OMZ 838]UTC43710.1 hypothetical protein E4N66_06295 [Treponema sp. OMZ 857]